MRRVSFRMRGGAETNHSKDTHNLRREGDRGLANPDFALAGRNLPPRSGTNICENKLSLFGLRRAVIRMNAPTAV